MKNHYIRTRSIDRKSDNAPEYAHEVLAVDISFADELDADTEIAVSAYNSSLHLMASDVLTATAHGQRRHFRFDLCSAEPWELDTYLFFIFCNGNPQWQARLGLWEALGCSDKGCLEPILSDSKEIRFLSHWRHSGWWHRLDRMNLPVTFIEDFTDWIMHSEQHRAKWGGKVFPSLFLVANDVNCRNFVEDVVARYVCGDDGAVLRCQLGHLLHADSALLQLTGHMGGKSLVVIDMDVDAALSYDDAPKLEQLASLMGNNSFTDTCFVLYGSSCAVENIVSCCPAFANTVASNEMVIYPGTPEPDLNIVGPMEKSEDFDHVLDDYLHHQLSDFDPAAS